MSTYVNIYLRLILSYLNLIFAKMHALQSVIVKAGVILHFNILAQNWHLSLKWQIIVIIII